MSQTHQYYSHTLLFLLRMTFLTWCAVSV